MTLDPRWLEILKASGWQMAAIAVACGLFLLINKWGWLPPLDGWMIQLAAIGFLLSVLLAIASFISAALKFFPVEEWVVHWVNIRREKNAVRDYIPHMTEQERLIIAYLLAKNQKMFTTEGNGGYAMTLISRGIVVLALRPGQMFDNEDTPRAIPDHIWDVLVEHKDQFPYSPPARGEIEADPWRVPWMAR
jgi:hypothetical protein